MPGDTLLVPANPNTISVLGEVHSPAIYPIPDGQTLTPSEALALAGGPVQDANTHGVSIVRRDASGNATVTHFDMSATLSGKSKTPEPALQNGDIVYIPARGQNQVNPWSLASLIPFAHL
jgi:protein involved in polysaccharide export with SLBB domain